MRRSRLLHFESLESRALLAADVGCFENGHQFQPIQAEGESAAPAVRFRLETADLSGSPISQVSVGDDFRLNIYVEDLRSVPSGVFAAYLDVNYDTGLLSAQPIPEFDSIYASQTSGDLTTDGEVDEVGAFADEAPGNEELLLASAAFTAQAAGTVNFVGDPADIRPFHDVLVFGTVVPVKDAAIDYGAASIEVIEVASLLVELDQTYNFFVDAAGLYENWGGAGEKWLRDDTNTWYYILPDGGMYRWSGSGINGTFVGSVGTEVHADPLILVNAAENAAAANNSNNGGDSGGSGNSDAFAAMVALDEQHEFHVGTSLYENWGGAGEKWLLDSANAWYFIKPSGEFYRWSGSGLRGTLIATLDPSVHADPYLLVNAAETAAAQAQADSNANNSGQNSGNNGEETVTSRLVELDQELGLYTTGNLYENWGGWGEKWVQGNGAIWYFITPDGSFYVWHGGSIANSTFLEVVDPIAHTDPAQLYNAIEIAAAQASNGGAQPDAATLDQQLGLFTRGELYHNWGGWNEKWMEGAGGVWYFIRPDGRFYKWHGGGITNSTQLYVLDPIYHTNPSLLYNAA